jgi:hypothetical protein
MPSTCLKPEGSFLDGCVCSCDMVCVYVLLTVHLDIFVIKTNLMHYLFSIYFVKQPLHVSGVFIAHHQEVFIVYVQQFVRVIRLGDWLLVGPS